MIISFNNYMLVASDRCVSIHWYPPLFLEFWKQDVAIENVKCKGNDQPSPDNASGNDGRDRPLSILHAIDIEKSRRETHGGVHQRWASRNTRRARQIYLNKKQ